MGVSSSVQGTACGRANRVHVVVGQPIEGFNSATEGVNECVPNSNQLQRSNNQNYKHLLDARACKAVNVRCLDASGVIDVVELVMPKVVLMWSIEADYLSCRYGTTPIASANLLQE